MTYSQLPIEQFIEKVANCTTEEFDFIYSSSFAVTTWDSAHIDNGDCLMWWISKGGFTGQLMEKPMELSAGQAIWISPGISYRFRVDDKQGETTGYNLRFRISDKNKFHRPKDDFFLIEQKPEILPYLEGLDIASRNQPQRHFYRIRSLVTLVLLGIHQTPENNVTNSFDHFNKTQLKQISEYIETHINHKILPSDFAQLLGMSSAYFSRKFTRHFGSSARRWILDYRLVRASKLLSHEEATIQEIAHSVGFDDPNFFAREFKKKYKISPREWRKNLMI